MPFMSADIEGDDITPYCQQIAWRPRLNLRDSATVRFPANFRADTVGDEELHVYLDGDLKFSGPLWFIQAEGTPNRADLECTAWDHRVHLGKLLCKWDDGGDDFNLINPCPVIQSKVYAPDILDAFIQNAIDDPAVADFDPSGPSGPYGPAAALPLSVSSVDHSGGENVDSCPMDFPMSIERMASLLVGTGQLDIILTPGIGASTIDLMTHYDNDLSGSVVYEYATGAHNCQIATLTLDMDDLVDALWFLLGPRGPRTVTIDGKIKRIPRNHWGGSITPTAPHTGGTWDSDLLDLIANARAVYGYKQEIQIHDDNGDEQFIRPVFEKWWQAEAEVRAVPREFLSIRPRRGLTPDFQVGDIIGVNAGTLLNGGASGGQVVYGFDLVQDANVISVEEIITSADQSLTG